MPRRIAREVPRVDLRACGDWHAVAGARTRYRRPMSEHHSRLTRSRGEVPFTYATYSRAHETVMGPAALSMSAAQAYGGDPTLANPEDLLVAALSSCHMLTFLAICARKGIVVDRYEDEAVGYLERPAGAPMHVARTILRPRVTFGAEPPSAEALRELHEQAHRGCFIASSVKTVVTVEPR